MEPSGSDNTEHDRPRELGNRGPGGGIGALRDGRLEGASAGWSAGSNVRSVLRAGNAGTARRDLDDLAVGRVEDRLRKPDSIIVEIVDDIGRPEKGVAQQVSSLVIARVQRCDETEVARSGRQTGLRGRCLQELTDGNGDILAGKVEIDVSATGVTETAWRCCSCGTIGDAKGLVDVGDDLVGKKTLRSAGVQWHCDRKSGRAGGGHLRASRSRDGVQGDLEVAVCPVLVGDHGYGLEGTAVFGSIDATEENRARGSKTIVGIDREGRGFDETIPCHLDRNRVAVRALDPAITSQTKAVIFLNGQAEPHDTFVVGVQAQAHGKVVDRGIAKPYCIIEVIALNPTVTCIGIVQLAVEIYICVGGCVIEGTAGATVRG